MYVLSKPSTSECEIKKSRFATIAAPIEDEEAARQFIAENSFADAGHNCWAWRIGGAYRFSDDGEPGGTAGRPILQAIEGQDVDRVCVVVSRWFGGIKLGTGGLARAYGGSAAECLRLADKQEVIPTATLVLAVGFSDLALVESRLPGLSGLAVNARDFNETGAVFTVSIPEQHVREVALALTELTNGRIVIEPDVLTEEQPS